MAQDVTTIGDGWTTNADRSSGVDSTGANGAGDDWTAVIEAARHGDDKALGEIAERLRNYLLLTADLGLGSGLRAKLAASDIVQQSLLEAQQDIGSFTGSTKKEVRAWLARIVENNLLDSARRFQQTQQRDVSREVSIDFETRQREIASPQKTGSSIVRHQETDEQLLQAVERLPNRQRQVVELRHRQGLSYAEIGDALNMTEAAARKVWSRAVENLRKRLSQSDACQTAQPR